MKEWSISYRQATGDDINFLWTLRQATMKVYVEKSYGWKDDEQLVYALENINIAQIIVVDGIDAGVLKVFKQPDHLFLSQFQVDPKWSGRGIGNRLLTELACRADDANAEIRLQVIKINPALQLYLKHGFKISYEMQHQYELTRKPKLIDQSTG